MIGTFTAAARLPQPDRDHAALIGQAEGLAALALLRQLGDCDWQRPTDCTEWDVRTLVSHLVAQCEMACAWHDAATRTGGPAPLPG